MKRSRGAEHSEARRIHAAAQRIADWRNSPRSKGHPQNKVIALIQELIHAQLQGAPSEEVYERYDREVRRISRKFPGIFVLRGADVTAPGSLWFKVSTLTLKMNPRATDWWGVASDLGILGPAGALWKIRECRTCQRPFAPKFSHEVSCSGKCKEKYKCSSPEYKSKRREKANKSYYEGLTRIEKKILEAKRARRVAKHIVSVGQKRGEKI
jgi:hypothetical protein